MEHKDFYRNISVGNKNKKCIHCMKPESKEKGNTFKSQALSKLKK